ncbi:hypothetical protein [uncultured Paraglaciecola sp.]|uniref:hypothetical protein n=1 Tax=uncultured Paraglaciecola sp. TaxID=1765024 RepID=UPI0026209034|nr:hypothetical protein [uncultured Paraglaciecola sp.]
MTTTNYNGGSRNSFNAGTQEAEMIAFDQLDGELRLLLKNTSVQFSAVQVTELLAVEGRDYIVNFLKGVQAKI